MPQTHIKIYRSYRHIAVMFVVIVLPFAFLFVFSRFSHIALSRLLLDIAKSFWRLALAYVIAATLGWLCAIQFYRGRPAAIALPIFDLLQSFPTSAALPVAALFWGASSLTVIFFLSLEIIWPVFFSTVSALRLIRRDWEEAVEMARLPWGEYFRKFLWPVSLPGLITGSIIGLGNGWEVLVATEIVVGIRSGLGSFFQIFSTNPEVTAFGILGLLIFIFSINKLLWLPLLDWSHTLTEE